jgi:hypothetical protein
MKLFVEKFLNECNNIKQKKIKQNNSIYNNKNGSIEIKTFNKKECIKNSLTLFNPLRYSEKYKILNSNFNLEHLIRLLSKKYIRNETKRINFINTILNSLTVYTRTDIYAMQITSIYYEFIKSITNAFTTNNTKRINNLKFNNLCKLGLIYLVAEDDIYKINTPNNIKFIYINLTQFLNKCFQNVSDKLRLWLCQSPFFDFVTAIPLFTLLDYSIPHEYFKDISLFDRFKIQSMLYQFSDKGLLDRNFIVDIEVFSNDVYLLLDLDFIPILNPFIELKP